MPIAILALCISCSAPSIGDTEQLSEEMTLALDVLTWVTAGNSKFNSAHGDEVRIASKRDIFVSGAPFEQLAEAGILPKRFTMGIAVDWTSIDWEHQSIVSMSSRHDDGSYTVNVVTGTLGRVIYEITVLDNGYQVRVIGMS